MSTGPQLFSDGFLMAQGVRPGQWGQIVRRDYSYTTTCWVRRPCVAADELRQRITAQRATPPLPLP